GSNETIRWAVRPSGRRAVGEQLARMRTANRRRRITIPPARDLIGGANEDVSWLRAKHGEPSQNYPSGCTVTTCPLQWRGRAGVTPAFLLPVCKNATQFRLPRAPSAKPTPTPEPVP